MSKKTLAEIKHLFDSYPNQTQFFETSDGEVFLSEDAAANYAASQNLEDQTVLPIDKPGNADAVTALGKEPKADTKKADATPKKAGSKKNAAPKETPEAGAEETPEAGAEKTPEAGAEETAEAGE